MPHRSPTGRHSPDALAAVPAHPSIGPVLQQHHAMFRYGAAVLLVLAIAALRLELSALLGREAPLLPFVLAVFASAWLGGGGPALLATLLTPFVITPMFTNWPAGNHVLAWSSHVGFFVIVGGLVSAMMTRLQKAAREQQAAAREARAAELEATRSADQLQLIADALPVLICYVDNEQRYRFNNKPYEHWYGQSIETMNGLHVRDVLGPDGYETLRPHMEAALAGQPRRVEADLPLAGSVRHISAHLVPDIGAGNEVRGYVAIAEDITERKRAEQAVQDRERMLKLIYDNASDCLYLVRVEPDDEFRFISVNETFLRVSGYTRQQVDDRPMEEVIARGNADLVRGHYKRVIETGAAVVYTESATLPAGRRFGEITLIPIIEDDGRVSHILGAIKDVTGRKLAEEALLEADRRKDEFLAMLAHELRNPLAPIRTIAHILKSEGLDRASVRRNSELLQRQAEHLTRLVDDLLDVARITRGVVSLKHARVSLQQALNAAMETVQPVLNLKHQTVNMSSGTTTLIVEGDLARLTQVFGNLLSNAVKFSPEHARIDVQVDTDDTEAVVRIVDRGVGIAADTLPHIFELFMQADRSLDRSQGGIGVGLTIVRRLVEMHGGRIEAHSAGLGMGSEFVVRLPLAAQQAVDPDSSATPVESPEETYRRVLVVDDNADAAESVALLLKMSGHEARAVHNGPDALDTLKNFDADVVLLDIGLPGTDGYAVARSIRDEFPNASRRIYALTGYGRATDRARAFDSGFDGHLVKPVDPQELLDAVVSPAG